MSRWSVWATAAVLLLLVVPTVLGNTFERRYEASSTYAYGDGHLGGAFCLGGQDTLFDTGGCVAYHVPGVYDERGSTLVVSIEDLVFGSDSWAVVLIDVDGDDRVDCAGADICLQGEGAVVTQIPLEATGRYVRVYPATVHTAGLPGIPDGFATSGTITFSFS